MSAPLFSVILPVYNQADHIAGLVAEYQRELERLQRSYEIVLVVNGPRDRTLEVCEAIAAECDPIRVIHSERAGWGLAVKTGLKTACGEIVCYTNSARTTGADLVLLLMYAAAYPDVVVKANRKIRESWRRRLGSLLYNLECRALFDLPVWDINGTPKVFPRKFETLLRLNREDDLIDLEFNVVCRREAYALIEVPILSNKRHGGRSTTNLRSAARMYLGAYHMWKRWKRAAR